MELHELKGLMAEQEMLVPRGDEMPPQVLGQLLTDDKVSLELDDFKIWAGLTSSAKLSFLEEVDRDIIMHLFESDVCRLIRIHPNLFRDGQGLFEVNQARIISRLNLSRSVGTSNPNKKNERIAITSERKEIVAGDNAPARRGLMGKLLGL